METTANMSNTMNGNIEEMMRDYEKQGLLHEMFVRQARKTPEKIAVVSADDRQMTYRELNDVTDTVAAALRHRGVRPESMVGIYMERSLEYTISYIAILKAGGAYMPIDVSYPIPLLEDILADSQPAAIVTEQSLTQYIPDAKNVIVCDEGWIERLAEENKRRGSLPPQPHMSLDNLAYTVYSSGTTGKPKGIQCPHRGAVFSYTWRHVSYPYPEDEREASNVFFVWEMMRPLLKGVTLYVVPDSVIYDPVLLCEFLKKHAITRILFTPSLFEAVLDAEGTQIQDALKSMRTILFCGEVVTTGLLSRCIKTLPWVKFVNLYSISEAHDIAYCDLTEWVQDDENKLNNRKFCPVGKLLPSVSVVIVNESMEPQPVGIPGEIYIGGPTLAKGYLNRPELNAKRFIKRPETIPSKYGDRLYKAGDWGYMMTDGSFEICGRCDSMVKIRGYSVETQAIEAALLELPMVNACVVIVMGEEGEDKYLVAYVVPEGKTSKKDIRAALKRRLPFYMIPSYFVLLSSIPILASSGKLDKKQLPPIDKTDTTSDPDSLPTTDTEKKLVPLWMDVLQLKAVDVQESFFDLGGHSLLASKLLAKIRETLHLELSVKDLFIHPSLSSLAKLIDFKLGTGEHANGQAVTPTMGVNLLKEVARHDTVGLRMDMQLRAFWRSMQYGERWNKGRVLLTGSTGFLGVYILRELLQESRTHIFCLVREQPDQKGIDRITSTMKQYGMLASNPNKATVEQQALESKLLERVTAVKGDVGLINMGMSEEDHAYLSTEIDFIIHAAAYVNLIYPYQALHGPNVLGTQNVLLFACANKIKPLHYISTDAVFPHGLKDCTEDAEMTQHAENLTDGYSQSKWVAEQLVLKAMERGLPAAVYRPGNISGDSKDAFWNPVDFNLLMLQGCLQCGYAPDVNWDVEMTPVDFISKIIVTLTQRMALGLGKVYHLTNTAPIKSKWLFEWINANGYRIKIIPFKKWIEKVESNRKGSDNGPLQRLVDGMIKDETFFSNLSTYRNDNVQRVLKILKESYPEINHALLSTYFKHLAKRRIIPPIRRNTTLDKPLVDRVAVVTGSSGGIGAGVAVHLARAGAKVALVARREDKLLELKTNIEDEGGVAITVKTDVTNRHEVEEMVKHTEYALGPIDILVNNAGIMYYTMMKNLKVDEWEKQIDLNCKGMMNCIGSVLGGMLERKSGHIVNMSSDAGRKGFAGLAVYSGTKFFVEGMSQGMRQELAQTGVKVTCIQPGDVRTELLSHTTDKEAKEQYDGSSSTKILEPDDIGRAVVYAVSQPPYCAVNEILIEPREAPC